MATATATATATRARTVKAASAAKAAANRRQTHGEKILRLFKGGRKVSLAELTALCPANYRARVSELRQRGYDIKLVERHPDGRTAYRLVGRKAVER